MGYQIDLSPDSHVPLDQPNRAGVEKSPVSDFRQPVGDRKNVNRAHFRTHTSPAGSEVCMEKYSEKNR